MLSLNLKASNHSGFEGFSVANTAGLAVAAVPLKHRPQSCYISRGTVAQV
jgi:hypothetical protein